MLELIGTHNSILRGMTMEIKGLTKTTLLDYPGHVSATLFVGGCDFKCPYCHNGSLVTKSNTLPDIPLEEIYHFLENHKGVTDAVCITGGEPTLYPDLKDIISHIKEMGYLVKLDTNGYNPFELNQLLDEHLVDYVSMDIKNCQEKYAKTAGCTDFDLTRIKLSVDLLKDSDIDYEFRTTVVREFHSKDDLISIAKWLKGAKKYCLQPYVESEDVLMPIFTSYSKDELINLKKTLEQYLPEVYLRE